MRLLNGICLILCVGWVTSAAAKPPTKKAVSKKKAAERKALSRQIAEDAGIMGALNNKSAFGAKLGVMSMGGDFRKADAAYERGDWVNAHALYAKGDVLAEKHMRFGASRAAVRYGHACQVLGRRCAVDVADALHDAQRRGLLAGIGSRRDKRSRLSRAMSGLMRTYRRAQQAVARDKTADADALFLAVHDQDPRCPGTACPPFILRQISGVYARQGRLESAWNALTAYLKAVPKHPERRTLKRQLKTWAGAAKQAKIDDAAALEANRVRVPQPGKSAPWLKTARSTPSPRLSIVAYGGRVGVGRLRIGKTKRWMGVRRGSAMIDGLAIPADAAWVAVGGDEQVYYATKAGVLYRAEVEAARAPFTTLGSAPNATHWDVQGSTVVASNDTQVWVWAKGATAPHAYLHPEAIGDAWARADGVVVFGDAQAAYVSADGGQTWTRTALGDMRALHRKGQRVAQYPRRPMKAHFEFGQAMPGRCAQGELTQDLQWVVPDDGYWRSGRGWETVFSVGSKARTPLMVPNGAGRSALIGGRGAAAEVAKCRADRKAYFNERGGAGGIASGGRGCTGLGCIDAPELPPAPVRFGLLGDGQCAQQDETAMLVGEQPKRRGFGRSHEPKMCAGLMRAGTLIRATATTFDVAPTISNCAPEHVESLGGIGVVSCVQADGTRALVVLDSAGAAQERLPIGGRVAHMGIAPDGTLAVSVRGPTAIDGAIRRPVALGEPNAWRIDQVPRAQVWRPVPGGHGFALTPGSKGEPVFKNPRIQRKRADGKRDYARWTSPRIDAVKACHAKAYASDPTVAGRLILTLALDETGTLTSVATDNRLRGDSEALLACITDVLQTDTHPKSAATEIAYLTLESKNNSLQAVLTAPGQPAQALTEDVVFERPPNQISARADGTVAVKPSTYPPKTCTLPKAGAFLCPKTR